MKQFQRTLKSRLHSIASCHSLLMLLCLIFLPLSEPLTQIRERPSRLVFRITAVFLYTPSSASLQPPPKPPRSSEERKTTYCAIRPQHPS